MICKHCGMENDDNATFCIGCGAELTVDYVAEAVEETSTEYIVASEVGDSLGGISSALGITSLVLTILGMMNLGLPLAITALVIGCVAGGKTKPFGIPNSKATTGKVTSIISLVLYALYILLMIVILVLYFLLIFGALGAATLDPMYYY